jgi:hypothetical protein
MEGCYSLATYIGWQRKFPAPEARDAIRNAAMTAGTPMRLERIRLGEVLVIELGAD